MAPTVPAPEASLTGEAIPGTIGFDLYLAALGAQRGVELRLGELPSDLLPPLPDR